jgi:uncharacterized membrane-anchored protein YitT (DUF2179 family)
MEILKMTKEKTKGEKFTESRKFIILRNGLFMFIGSILYAFGLRAFIVPNHFIDGGVTGLSIITSYLTGLPISAFVIVFNIPFFILGFRMINRIYTISTIFSIILMSVFIEVFGFMPPVTNDLILAAVFGGIILGIGIGIIIRYGGSLDGTETVGIILDKKTGFSVGEIVFIINLFIMTLAGFIFGWDKAMYSMITYFIAFKVIDITIEGFNDAKNVMIVSEKANELSIVLMLELGKGLTLISAKGGYSGNEKNIIYTVITRFEIARLKSIVNKVDPYAFITITDVTEVMGGSVKKKKK